MLPSIPNEAMYSLTSFLSPRDAGALSLISRRFCEWYGEHHDINAYQPLEHLDVRVELVAELQSFYRSPTYLRPYGRQLAQQIVSRYIESFPFWIGVTAQWAFLTYDTIMLSPRPLAMTAAAVLMHYSLARFFSSRGDPSVPEAERLALNAMKHLGIISVVTFTINSLFLGLFKSLDFSQFNDDIGSALEFMRRSGGLGVVLLFVDSIPGSPIERISQFPAVRRISGVLIEGAMVTKTYLHSLSRSVIRKIHRLVRRLWLNMRRQKSQAYPL